jgi:hypothetical protein
MKIQFMLALHMIFICLMLDCVVFLLTFEHFRCDLGFILLSLNVYGIILSVISEFYDYYKLYAMLSLLSSHLVWNALLCYVRVLRNVLTSVFYVVNSFEDFFWDHACV